MIAALRLVDVVRLREDRLFLEEAELRPPPAGKAIGTASGDSRSQALALPGQWALGKNDAVLESFRFVAAVAVTVSSDGGGAGVCRQRRVIGMVLGQWEQELLKWVLRLVLSNLLWPMHIGKGGGCTGPYFLLPAAGPHSPRRRGREGLSLYAVRFGDLGSAGRGAALGVVPAGAPARGAGGS